MPQSPLTVQVTVTPEDLALVMGEQMHGLSVAERARVMNILLHDHRAIFDALLQRPSRESCGLSLPSRTQFFDPSKHAT